MKVDENITNVKQWHAVDSCTWCQVYL